MARNASVTLDELLDHFVLKKINAGRYQSVSEVVRAGLRKLEEDETKLQVLRDKLQAGEDSPLVENFNADEFIKDLHKKHLK